MVAHQATPHPLPVGGVREIVFKAIMVKLRMILCQNHPHSTTTNEHMVFITRLIKNEIERL